MESISIPSQKGNNTVLLTITESNYSHRKKKKKNRTHAQIIFVAIDDTISVNPKNYMSIKTYQHKDI